MPGRLRQPTATLTEATQPEHTYQIPGLHYDEALGWRAGKAITTSDLLLRLQKLAGLLRKYDEDIKDQGAVLKLAHDLAHSNLLGHKDKGVRALAIVCIVDLLRICAPNAPFNAAELKSIFTTIITSILPCLADPSNAYNAQHVYTLSSLAEFKSICLILDVNNSDSLVLPLFSTCFDIVSGIGKSATGIELGKTVEYNLNVLLATLIEEISSLPQELTDIILSQFLRVDPRTTLNSRAKRQHEKSDEKQGKLLHEEYPPAYNMAKATCTTCSERMTIQISHYFATVIVNATEAKQNDSTFQHGSHRMSDLDVSDEDDGELGDLIKAHRLIRELWRACPDVLHDVIPQIEAELSAESVQLRLMATETIGDMIAGIGISGIAPSNAIDSAAYPLPTIDQPQANATHISRLLLPMSPKPFTTVHAAAYQSFLGRRHDKSPSVRSSWATAVTKILLTSAGGIGFGESEEEVLLTGLAQVLGDADERVRIAAIKGISSFGYSSLVNCLGNSGGITKEGTVLNALAHRVRDRRHAVREEAIRLLGQFWGIASRDIENGNEKVNAIIGDAPSRILEAYFTNEPDVHALLDKVIFELILPITFPPIKVQISRSDSQKERAKDKEGESQEGPTANPDAIRVGRLLTLVRGLSGKAKQVFYAMQSRQAQLAKITTVFLSACEEYNGGVVEENEEQIKAQLAKVIDGLAKTFPNSTKVSLDLWKFAELHDRRNYQLIRFATGPANDYRTVTKAIKELSKRLQTGPANSQALLETINQLLYRCSLLIYNRSHVPSIMDISRSDENGLAETAHEVLKQISTHNPEVLKTHIQEICRDLEINAPTISKHEDHSAADALKACAAFAHQYPAEVTKERRFLTALTGYAVFAQSPRAAKHAVSIIMSVADKKEMYATEILQKALKDWKLDSSHALPRLAAIAQICLLAPAQARAKSDAIIRIALEDILSRKRATVSESTSTSTPAILTPETTAKELALKILVNRCRAEHEDPAEFEKALTPVYTLLMRLIEDTGEITTTENASDDQKSRLRLAAAKSVLKLCSKRRRCEEAITPMMFNSIAQIVLNPPSEVRVGFVNQLRKYLGLNRLHHRWFVILFLLAFEPDADLKTSTVTWLRSRAQFFARQQQQARAQGKKAHENVMELLLARFLSLLAYHPDYPEAESESFDDEILDFAKYICFYLSAVATDDNLSLIYHVAQRVKQARDGVTGTDEMSKRLYVLSDLATTTIRHFADLMPAHAKGVNLLQTWPGKTSLPTSLFAAMKGHQEALDIAEKNYLPEEVASELERVVRACVKGGKSSGRGGKKKRKSAGIAEEDDEDDIGPKVKKVKRVTTLPMRKVKEMKTPRRKSSSEAPSSEVRKSTRVSNAQSISYAEGDTDEEDDEELMEYAVRRKSEKASKTAEPDLISDLDENTTNVKADEKENDAFSSHGGHENEDQNVMEDENTSPPSLKEKSNINSSDRAVIKRGNGIVAKKPSVTTGRQTRRTKA